LGERGKGRKGERKGKIGDNNMFTKIEDIEVWKKGCRLTVDIYKITAKTCFDKDWGLREQLRKASVSIPSNIAEGYERNSKAEF
jgi:hypothetical protein